VEILSFPHPNLFFVCREVTVFGPELLVLLESMWDTMVDRNALGLASNQVNLKYRMFVMRGPNREKLFIVNPKVIKHSQGTIWQKEGCLSASGELMIYLSRPGWVTLEYQNEKGEKCSRTFEDMLSACVQHEIDHLDGKSYLLHKSVPKDRRIILAKKWDLKGRG